MAWANDSVVGQVALKVGLPTPVPDRWDTVSDELLEQYILGYGRVLDDPDIEATRQASIVGAFNEHVKARHKIYFDIVADYYQRANENGARQLFSHSRRCVDQVLLWRRKCWMFITLILGGLSTTSSPTSQSEAPRNIGMSSPMMPPPQMTFGTSKSWPQARSDSLTNTVLNPGSRSSPRASLSRRQKEVGCHDCC